MTSHAAKASYRRGGGHSKHDYGLQCSIPSRCSTCDSVSAIQVFSLSAGHRSSGSAAVVAKTRQAPRYPRPHTADTRYGRCHRPATEPSRHRRSLSHHPTTPARWRAGPVGERNSIRSLCDSGSRKPARVGSKIYLSLPAGHMIPPPKPDAVFPAATTRAVSSAILV